MRGHDKRRPTWRHSVERVEQAFRTPFSLSGHLIAVTASVGMAYAGRGEEISDQLLVKADTAMYQAKRKGGGVHQVIDLRQAMDDDERSTLETDLGAALLRDKLDVAYQPILRCADKTSCRTWRRSYAGQTPRAARCRR